MNLTRLTSEVKETFKAPTPEVAPLSLGGHRSVEALADVVGITHQSGSYLSAVGDLPSEQQE